MTPEQRNLFAHIRLLSLDCDGVMTDGGLYYAADGTEFRRFHVRDGVGIKAVMNAGIEVAFVTASTTPSIEFRARALGVKHCILGASDKVGALTELCDNLGIGLPQVAHVGDDLNDLPVLECVGLPITVADAVPAVLERVTFVTSRAGGQGAVREICEHMLEARSQPLTGL